MTDHENHVEMRETPNGNGGALSATMDGRHDDYLSTIIEHTADAIIAIDERGKIEVFNAAAEKLFGYTRDEAIGQNIKMLMPSPFRDEHDRYLAKYRSTGHAKIIGKWREVTGQRKDGSTVPIEIGVRELHIGGHRRFTGIVRDLTLNKIAQEAQAMLAVSAPVITVWDGVLVLPLIGTLDSKRAQDICEKSLTRLSEERAHALIIDITGVPVVDTMVANSLISLSASVRLMGGHCIITGISPTVAQTIVELGIDLSAVDTRGTLSEGLRFAITLADKDRSVSSHDDTLDTGS